MIIRNDSLLVVCMSSVDTRHTNIVVFSTFIVMPLAFIVPLYTEITAVWYYRNVVTDQR